MGKGPKHNMNKPRSNGIFKVAGTNFKTDRKGKAKEVSTNLKSVCFSFVQVLVLVLIFQISIKHSKKVAELDQTLVELQKASASAGKSLGGDKNKGRTVGEEVSKLQRVDEQEMLDLANNLCDKT